MSGNRTSLFSFQHFLSVAEALCLVRTNNFLAGIRMGRTEHELSHFADDAVIFLTSTANVQYLSVRQCAADIPESQMPAKARDCRWKRGLDHLPQSPRKKQLKRAGIRKQKWDTIMHMPAAIAQPGFGCARAHLEQRVVSSIPKRPALIQTTLHGCARRHVIFPPKKADDLYRTETRSIKPYK